MSRKRILYVRTLPTCDIGKNKAQVLAERYAGAFGIKANYIPDFIESKFMLEELEQAVAAITILKDLKLILIGAVDNNRSRQMCHEVFQESRNIIYIDSGNGEYTGQMVCGIRKERSYYNKACCGNISGYFAR